LLASLIVLLAGACAGPSAPPTTPSRTAVSVQPPRSTPLADPPAEPASSGLRATIATSLGEIQIELFDRSAPVATENFVNLARAGFYDGVVFHRLVPGFVIQGGDPEGTGRGGPGYTIRDETVVGQYARGIVAMARSREPDSQGSQFFIILDDRARRSLDVARTYVIFGRVTTGMDVIDRIAAMPNSGEPENRALQPVAMDRVTVSGP
jgi:cyclophilin family peptidyl-prolyl cis-trans isomerase